MYEIQEIPRIGKSIATESRLVVNQLEKWEWLLNGKVVFSGDDKSALERDGGEGEGRTML